MNFISHAGQLEDVMLWRALRHVEAGFYIDVGAADPHAGSVTRAFYERGWRGVNLEPNAARQRALRLARPFDINLALAASAEPGSAVLFEVDGGAAGFDPEAARQAAAAGLKVIQREVELATLDAVCAAHAAGPIHFLRIDVGGAEAAVLAGLDLARWRPWLLLVRWAGAGAPAWQAELAGAGYALAYRDGRNLFYVAAEQAALAAALALPPHAADDFVLHEGHAWAYPVADLLRRAADADERAAAAARTAQEARDWAAARSREIEQQADAAIKQLAQQIEHAQARATAAETGAEAAAAELARIERSLSWRLTRPLRRGASLARRIQASLRHRLGAARRRIKASLRHRLGAARGAVGGALRAVALRAVHFVVARPALAYFARRQIARHPALTLRLRTLVLRMRARQNPGAPAPADSGVELQHLPDSARRLLRQLQRRVPPSP